MMECKKLEYGDSRFADYDLVSDIQLLQIDDNFQLNMAGVARD